MKVIEEKYNWSGSFGERKRTEEIVIHHRAGSGNAQSGIVEQVEIASSNWVASTDTGVYSYKTSITLNNLTANSLSIELINNEPVLFSTYGFAIAEINDNNNVIVYSIGQPTDTVTLTFEIVKELISFTIEGTSYQAEDGMTWKEWVDSNYNTGGYTYSGNEVACPEGGYNYLAESNDYFVDLNDIIIANTEYKHKLMD